MKIIGKTTFGTIFLCFILLATVTNASAQDPRTLTEEEQVLVDNHVKLTRQEYIHKWCHHALQNRELYGIPASITLGQAILESGYGNSALSIITNNHFNIKCKNNWEGRTRTWSDDNPDDCFRVYDSIEESYDDHGDYVSSRSWYEFLFAYDLTDYKSWAKGLKKAGYATDPNYAENLIRVIEDTHIYLLDEENGLERYNEYLAASLGIEPVGNTKDEENGNSSDEKSNDANTTITPPAEETEHDHMAKAYADNGIDPNLYRVTINSHHGYSVYFTNGTHYVVAKANDTYASIAKLFELSEGAIRSYNDVNNGAQLHKGDIVYVERKSARWQGNDLLHKVAEGETLHMLSQIYGIRLNQLSKMNRIRPTDPLKVGQTIRLR
ncbi:MAG: LysM peptidoglycan-binding domain-containing protein [Rikenellaceae bacterium]|nr:LysM peptidoglycan-binding domain-containing protein [Rikenellaceae bacterium]